MTFTDTVAEIVDLRRKLHRIPEIAFQEFETTRLIRETLESWGLKLTPFETVETGGYCDIGEGDGLAYRSDIDGLPIEEPSEHRICSIHPGRMHACGHDFHTAIGLGILRLLSQQKRNIKGRLRVIFQPAEEAAPGGAETLSKENLFAGIRGILTAHVFPDGKPGEIFVKPGPCCASSTTLKLVFNGPGGHTSRPQETVDLVQVAAQFIAHLKEYVSSRIDQREAFALVFGEIHAGNSHNIIPSELQMRGTLRTFSAETVQTIQRAITRYIQLYQDLYGVEIALSYPTNCPPVRNDPDLYESFVMYMQSAGFQNQLKISPKPSMGADDFSFYLHKLPGLYVLLAGTGKGALHSSELVLPEEIIEAALRYLPGFIIQLLTSSFE